MKRPIQLLFVLLTVTALGQAIWQYAHLPATVATHFGIDGRANGWMSREANLALSLTVILFIAGLLEGIARLNAHIPNEFINIPHREYWLAPERREATQAWLAGFIRLCGCVVLGLFVGLFHQVYRANLGAGELTTSTALLVGISLVVLFGLIAACLLRFLMRPS